MLFTGGKLVPDVLLGDIAGAQLTQGLSHELALLAPQGAVGKDDA